MDLFSLGFLLVILIASGFIAYVADGLGKKLGKKRLSLWGLRPRHVASIGTVVMGVAVSFFTILIVAAASRDARTWLQEGRQLLIQRDELLNDNKRLKLGNDALLHDSIRLGNTNRDLESKNGELGKTNEELKKRLDAQRTNLAHVQAQREHLAIEAKRLEGDRDRLNRELASARKGLANTRLALSANQALVKKTLAHLKDVQASLDSLQTQVKTANQNIDAASTKFNFFNKKLNDALTQGLQTYIESLRLQGEVAAGEARVAELVTQREDAEKKLTTAQAQYSTTQARLDRAASDLVQLQQFAQSQSTFLNDTFKTSRTEPMTFRINEEVARVVVPGGATVNVARNALTTLLRSARVEAQNRGARGHRVDGRTFEVADVFDRQDPKTGTDVSADMLKQAVIARAAGRVEDEVLIATSSYNAFAGEVVSLDIAVMPNPVVYRRNDILSEARIDGSLTEDRIFAQLSEFVRSRVRDRAVQDRMIPRSGTDAPFGEIPTFDVLNLVRDVKRIGHSVRVQAVADADIRAADPLKLEFRIR